MTSHAAPDPLKGAMAGLFAGLVASAVMDGFQRLAARAMPSSGDAPATEQAADRIAMLTTGEPVPEPRKGLAADLVHYATGTGLGIAYGVAAEFVPDITRGGGTAFASGVAGLLDEAAVPALGLARAPWNTEPSRHAYGAASHIVFGLVIEGVRAAIRRR